MLSIETELETGLLDAMTTRVDNAGELLQVLGEELLTFEERAFATSGFGEWPANDPVTAAFKSGGRVLVDTGSLLRELTSRGALNTTADSVEVTTDHVGAVMAARGARGAPVRNATPQPDSTTVKGWADVLLAALVSEA